MVFNANWPDKIVNYSPVRCIEAAFGLSVAISAAHIGIELARIVQLMTSYESKANRVFTKGFFILSVLFM